MGGTGWCTHPKRKTSSDVRILVRKAELACRNAWGEDLWEALDSAEIDESAASAPELESTVPSEMPLPISYEDEVTSVVDADIHRAQTGQDLNDRIVDQSNLDPDEEDDDRFDLLARGGRDSVSKARNRMRRRRGGHPESPANEAPSPSEADDIRFAPDDFVEEEGPARSDATPDPEVSPYDDVMISENVPQGSPRSRRIRRERERQTHPKADAVVETNPDVPAPANTPGATDLNIGDPFNTVPEIASDIDISRLRKPGLSVRDETPSDSRPRRTPESTDTFTFEQGIRSADAIRAAARAEREERHRQNRRAQILPRAAVPAEPREADAPASLVHPAQPEPRRAPAVVPAPQDASIEQQAPPRVRMSTRDVDDDAGQHVALHVAEHPADHRQDDPSVSWWRGIFMSRQKQESPEQFHADEMDVSVYDDDEDFVFEHQPVTNDQPWPDMPAEWDDHDVVMEHQGVGRVPENELHIDRSEETERSQPSAPAYTPLDLEAESDLESYRDRLFNRSPAVPAPRALPRRPQSALSADELLADPADAWYEPDPVPDFDLRRIVERAPELLDMTIEISPEVSRQCATCRSYRQSERGGRGWCTNTWAFTHRQMVNATDLACASTIGCWWLPADEEVWLDDSEPERGRTPRVDRLIAHLDPLKKAVGR